MGNDIENNLNNNEYDYSYLYQFINEHINRNIKCFNDYDLSVQELLKVSEFIRKCQIQTQDDLSFDIVKNNDIVKQLLKVVVNNDLLVIKEGLFDSVYDDQTLNSLVEGFCAINNIYTNDEEGVNSSTFISEIISDSYRMYIKNVNTERLTKEEELDLISRAQHGDNASMEELVNRNLMLVIKVASRYKNRGLDELDLFQEGSIGLMKAIKKYDYDENVRLSTYAVYWIRQAISRSIHSSSLAIRVPSSIYEQRDKILQIKSNLSSKLGREATTIEIANELCEDPRKIYDVLQSFSGVVSLNYQISDEGDTELGDFIPDDENIEDNYISQELITNLKATINNSGLKQREIDIIARLYGLGGTKKETLDEIGKTYGLSRERIRQIENRTLKKLRLNECFKEYSHYMDDPEKAKEVIDTSVNDFKNKISRIVTKKACVKSIYEYFVNYNKEEIDKAILMLNNDDKKILYLKYGDDLSNPITSDKWDKKLDYQFGHDTLSKIKRRLEDQEKEKPSKYHRKLKTIYQSCSNYSMEQIDRVIALLNEKDKRIFDLRFGSNFKEPTEISRLNEKDKEYFNAYLLPKFKRALASPNPEEVLIGGRKLKSIYELFEGYSSEEVDHAITILNERDQQMVKHRLNATRANGSIAYNYFVDIRKKINQILKHKYTKEQFALLEGDISFYALFNGYSNEEIEAALSKMPSEIQNFIEKKFNKDNERYIRCARTDRDTICKITDDIVPKIINVLEKRYDSNFKHLSIEQSVIMYLIDGLVFDKKYSPSSIAKFLNVAEETIYAMYNGTFVKEDENNEVIYKNDKLDSEVSLNALKQPLLMHMINTFTKEELVLASLSLGFIGNKCYSSSEISSLIGIPVEEVRKSVSNTLLKYKEKFTSLVDIVVSRQENSKVLMK